MRPPNPLLLLKTPQGMLLCLLKMVMIRPLPEPALCSSPLFFLFFVFFFFVFCFLFFLIWCPMCFGLFDSTSKTIFSFQLKNNVFCPVFMGF